MTRIFLAALAVSALPVLAFSTGAFAADPPLAVTGLVVHPLHLSLADLKAFPATHVSATQASAHGPVPLDCTGVSVSAVLDKASLKVGDNNNAKLAHSVLVTADDGYAVALSLGELDPDYGNATAIIATACGGKALDDARLVVPGDKHGGRAVKGVVSIEVKVNGPLDPLQGLGHAHGMARLSIRIDFEPSGSALGPGMAELLERIGKLGSIRKAASSMDMSYRKAWLLLQGMQKTFGAPVVVTETGGSTGGGAQLTELGGKLLKIFRTIEKAAGRAADDEMHALSALVQQNAAPRAKGRHHGSGPGSGP